MAKKSLSIRPADLVFINQQKHKPPKKWQVITYRKKPACSYDFALVKRREYSYYLDNPNSYPVKVVKVPKRGWCLVLAESDEDNK
jgi:hypothetical protein